MGIGVSKQLGPTDQAIVNRFVCLFFSPLSFLVDICSYSFCGYLQTALFGSH